MFGLSIINKLHEDTTEPEIITEIIFSENGGMKKEEIKNIENYLTVNTKITISLMKEGYTGVYDSRVEDVDKSAIVIAQPSSDGVPVPMVPGTKAIVEFVNNSGRFRFETNISGRRTVGSMTLAELEVPKTMTRSQLREFYRVDTRVKGKIKLFYSGGPDKNMRIPHKTVDCVVNDISGGGGKLITSGWLENKQEFLLDLSSAMPELDNLPCVAIRVKKVQEKTEVSFRFNITKESERNQIIKYVFKRQIELKQFFG